jgi:hypothetical protein
MDLSKLGLLPVLVQLVADFLVPLNPAASIDPDDEILSLSAEDCEQRVRLAYGQYFLPTSPVPNWHSIYAHFQEHVQTLTVHRAEHEQEEYVWKWEFAGANDIVIQKMFPGRHCFGDLLLATYPSERKAVFWVTSDHYVDLTKASSESAEAGKLDLTLLHCGRFFPRPLDKARPYLDSNISHYSYTYDDQELILALDERELFCFEGNVFIVFECNEIRYAFVLSEKDPSCIQKFLLYALGSFGDGPCRCQTTIKIDCTFEARSDALARHINSLYRVHPLLIATIDTAFRCAEWLAQQNKR